MKKQQETENSSLRPGKFLVCVSRNESSRVALSFACKKAKKSKALVDILTVIEPADFQPLFGKIDRIVDDRRTEAEKLLAELAHQANEESGITPTLLVRQGKVGEEIIAAAMEDSDINMVIIGISPERNSYTKLVSWLAERMGDELLVPLILVPGNLTEQQVDALT